MRKPRYLISCIGTTGDALPFIGLGAELRAAGHEVVVAGNQAFQTLVESAGLVFEEIGKAERYHETVSHPDFYHPTRSFTLMAENLVFPILERSVELTREYTSDGNTAVLASTISLGSRIAYDLDRFPYVSVNLQPFAFSSAHDLRIAPGPNLPRWSPLPLKRAYIGICDSLVDRFYGPRVDAVRAKWGLPPVRSIFCHWRDSPELVLGLFPDWFAQPQPDWPPQTRHTEFPLYDQSEVMAMPDTLVPFLEASSPLLIFTIGSAAVESVARIFFQESVAASQILGCRALLLTGAEAYLPAALPPSVQHHKYVPLSRILPRTAAVIHHGGLGTGSLALAAGVPQLMLPFGHDQFDNAARFERLGVARTLRLRDYKSETVARLLRDLLESAEVRARCQDYKARIAAQKPYQETLRLLQDHAAGHAS